MKENRAAARAFIAKWEGDGFNAADDNGRGSMRGITMTLFEQYCSRRLLTPPTPNDLRNLSEDLAADIMWGELGDAIKFDDLPAGVDLQVLDKVYQLGITGGLRLFQSALDLPGTSFSELADEVVHRDPRVVIRDLAVAWGGAKSQSKKWSKHPPEGNDDGHACGPGWKNRKVDSITAALALLPPVYGEDHHDGCSCDIDGDLKALLHVEDHQLPSTSDHTLKTGVLPTPLGLPANAYSLKWLPTVLADAGLKVSLVDGWATRGHGDMSAMAQGVICHHTAGSKVGNMGSLRVVRDGRPDLAGPLAQLGLGRDGTFYVIAAGKCWHAGAGFWRGVTSGNSLFIGIEAENSGAKDDPWPTVQMDAYVRGVAAILKHVGRSEAMCCGHYEWALPKGRKNDPNFSMPDFRAQVAKIMQSPR